MKNANQAIKIIFIGTPEFGAIILEGLIKNNYKPVLVISSPDEPVGRKQILTPPPVKVVAQNYGIPLLQPAKIENCKVEIENLNPDLLVVAAYRQIMPEEILNIPKFGCLNIHPSLLPRYRGASPIQTAILNGDKETGVSIILMDKILDHGKIVSAAKYKMLSDFTYKELEEELAELSVNLLIKTLPSWMAGEIKAVPQDDSEATYTKVIKKEGGEIDWRKSAEEIERQVRAFNSWPGSFTFWQKNEKTSLRIKILKADSVKLESNNYSAGQTFQNPKNNGLCVKCGKGFLEIKELQIEGKNPQRSEDFLRGYPGIIGIILK